MSLENTKNARLLETLGGSDAYLNTEYTLPCLVKNVFVCDEDTLPPDQRSFLNTPRTIITPHTYSKLAKVVRNKVEIMCSTHECGRVLEMNETVWINKKPFMVSVKGVGSTTFTRTTGGMQNWMFGVSKKFQVWADRLTKCAFATHRGSIELDAAENELKCQRSLAVFDVETVKVVAIQKIVKMADESGTLQGLDYFYNKNILEKDRKICLIYRLQKTNFRLADIFILREQNRPDAVCKILDHIKNLFAIHEERDAPTIQDYFFWLTEKLISECLQLIFNGYKLTGANRWLVLARNITLLGEQIDLESLEPDDSIAHRPDYLYHIQREVMTLENVLRITADVINSCYPEKVDFGGFAKLYYDCMMATIHRNAYLLELKEAHLKASSEQQALKEIYYDQLLNDLISMVFISFTAQMRSTSDQRIFSQSVASNISSNQKKAYFVMD